MPSIVEESTEFVVSPKIVPDTWKGTVRITGDYEHTRFLPGVDYAYELTSMFFSATSDRKNRTIGGETRADDTGALSIPFEPDMSGEWLLTIRSRDESGDERKTVPMTVGLYVLPDRLRGFRPYIGELHAHSTASDGRQEPAYPAMRARALGLDFFALTDHRSYDSSVRMIRDIGARLGSRMVLLRGEELHPERGEILGENGDDGHAHKYHYVAVGHHSSVRDAILEGGEAVKREVKAIAEELRRRGFDDDIDIEPYAEGVWKLRKTRELGGIGIYCHPYWAYPVNLDSGAIRRTLRDREFDAVEAISRADFTSYTTNLLLESAAAGIAGAAETAGPAGTTEPFSPIPMVGVSDAHDWQESIPLQYCTFIMAEHRSAAGLSAEDVLDSIRSGRCVACRMSEPPELLGPVELVDFASFYLRRILPIRRRIMSLQGNLALSSLRGGPFSQDLIDALDEDLLRLNDTIGG